MYATAVSTRWCSYLSKPTINGAGLAGEQNKMKLFASLCETGGGIQKKTNLKKKTVNLERHPAGFISERFLVAVPF